ncbi:MAG: DUF5131 family protein [Solimonas sp.]
MSDADVFKFVDLEASARAESKLFDVLGNEQAWYPILGCRPVSVGCEHCTGLKLQNAWLTRNGRETHTKLQAPIELAQEYERIKHFARDAQVVVAPGSDLFDEAVSDATRDHIIRSIASRPDVLFYWFTKHADRQRDYLLALSAFKATPGTAPRPVWPLPNVRIGVSIEDDDTYRQRAPFLFETPAMFRILRFEPLLGPVNIEKIELWSGDILWPLRGIVQAYGGMREGGERFWLPIDEPLTGVPTPDLIIIGGERGDGARPPHPLWIRHIEKAARTWGVPLFFRGWGSYAPTLKPDRESDRSLIIVSIDGYRRGRGAGSATNFLATQSGLGRDIHFTRPASDGDPALYQYPGSTMNDRPEWHAPLVRQRITDVSESARDLQRLHARERYQLLQQKRWEEESARVVASPTRLSMGQRVRDILTTPLSELPQHLRHPRLESE